MRPIVPTRASASFAALSFVAFAFAGTAALPIAEAHPQSHVVCAQVLGLVEDPTACMRLEMDERTICSGYDCHTILTIRWTYQGVDVCGEVVVHDPWVEGTPSCGYVCTEVRNLEPIYCQGSMSVVFLHTYPGWSRDVEGRACVAHSDTIGMDCKEWSHHILVPYDVFTSLVPSPAQVQALAAYALRTAEDATADPLP